MVIADPDHWKELYGDDKGPKYAKIVEIITDTNLNSSDSHPDPHPHAPIAHKTSHHTGGGDLLAHQSIPGSGTNSHPTIDTHIANGDIHVDFAPASPYLVEYSANMLQGYVSGQSHTQNVDKEGVHQNATGTQYIYLEFDPPEWLMRYAEDQSKTITLTQIVIRWDNTVSADYITRTDYYWVDNDSGAYQQLWLNTGDLGNGTTGFRNDTINGIDHVMDLGNAIHVRIDVQQTTVNSCRVRGIQARYDIT